MYEENVDDTEDMSLSCGARALRDKWVKAFEWLREHAQAPGVASNNDAYGSPIKIQTPGLEALGENTRTGKTHASSIR